MIAAPAAALASGALGSDHIAQVGILPVRVADHQIAILDLHIGDAAAVAAILSGGAGIALNALDTLQALGALWALCALCADNIAQIDALAIGVADHQLAAV